MREPLAGPRVLLRRLREIMAEPISAQDRLDKIVHADRGQHGGRGLLGLCAARRRRARTLRHRGPEARGRPPRRRCASARAWSARSPPRRAPLNLSDAQTHPAFAYLPETGEEIYHSFLGVPILRAGRTLGVLVVQNRAHRTYQRGGGRGAADDRDGARRDDRHRRSGGPVAARALARPHAADHAVTGVGFSEGIGLGHVVLHEPRVVVTNSDRRGHPTRKSARLDEALASLRLFVDDMLSRGDVGVRRRASRRARSLPHVRPRPRLGAAACTRRSRNGLTAEAAVEKVQSDMRARLQRQTDPYLRERLHDFDDLANRLLRVLMGKRTGRRAARRCRRTRSSSPATWARPNCSTMTASSCAAWCSRRAAPTSHVDDRRPGARHRHCRPGRRTVRLAGRERRRDHRRRRDRRGPSPAAGRCRSGLCREGALPRQRQEHYRLLRDQPSVTRDGDRDRRC